MLIYYPNLNNTNRSAWQLLMLKVQTRALIHCRRRPKPEQQLCIIFLTNVCNRSALPTCAAFVSAYCSLPFCHLSTIRPLKRRDELFNLPIPKQLTAEALLFLSFCLWYTCAVSVCITYLHIEIRIRV